MGLNCGGGGFTPARINCGVGGGGEATGATAGGEATTCGGGEATGATAGGEATFAATNSGGGILTCGGGEATGAPGFWRAGGGGLATRRCHDTSGAA